MTSEAGQTSKVLKKAAVVVQPDCVCGVAEERWRLRICAGTQKPLTDACHGDKGGPLMFRGPDGALFVGGVVSVGNGCKARGLYTRVSAYEFWIEETLNEN